jgi:hypothetical protein
MSDLLQEVLVDTQCKDHLDDPKVRIAEVDYDSSSNLEMKKKRIKKTSTVFFIVVTFTALFAVTLIPSSQQASAVVHHKVAVHHIAHTVSKGTISVHHKVHHKVAVHKKAHTVSSQVSTSVASSSNQITEPMSNII